jgi:hypothetical protein
LRRLAILVLKSTLAFSWLVALACPQDSSALAPAQTTAAETSGETGKSKKTLRIRRRGMRKPPIDDYVPCLFDEDQAFDLRAIENPNPVRSADDPVSSEESEGIYNELQALAKTQLMTAQNREKTAINEWSKEKDPAKKAQLESYKTGLQGAQQAFSNLSKQVQKDSFVGLKPIEIPQKLSEFADKSGITDKTAKNIVMQIGSKVLGISDIERPDDVSCSCSIVDWNETSDIFGRRVANEYVAIQVNVRNLADTNEFLIHDIQIAVDTGMNFEQFGRFQVGRDKLMVRAVAERGKSEDRRNLIINTLQMIGAISAGASSAVTQAVSGETTHLGDVETANKLSSAVEIFQGAFIPGLINIFPDHTLEHINHISDLAFSASSTLKTVVPRQGSVPLTTFLAERPLEQLPFSRCGSLIQRINNWEAFWDTFDKEYKIQRNDGSMNDTPGSPEYPFCQYEQDIAKDYVANPIVYTKAIHYKKWRPAALQLLQKRMFVVVAGVHIQEIKNVPRIDNVKCPSVIGGSVDLSIRDKDGNISCTVTGAHLDKVASVKLGQGDKAVQFKPASDGNSATLSFKADDFNGVTGSLPLILKDSAGKETDSGLTLTFSVRAPKVDQVLYKDKSQDPNQDLQAVIYGSNLDRIATITLTDSSKPTAKTYSGTIENADTVTFSTNPISVIFKDLKPASVTRPASISFTTKDDAAKKDGQAKPEAVTGKDTTLKNEEKPAAAKKAENKVKKIKPGINPPTGAPNPASAAPASSPTPSPGPTQKKK